MGSEVATWDDESDLVTFHRPLGEQDPFSQWVFSTLIPWYHKCFGYSRKKVRIYTILFHLSISNQNKIETKKYRAGKRHDRV
jgi:hypothetical protein